MERFRISEIPRDRYHEMHRTPDLSTGVYRIAKGAEDTQKPHAEDEIYFVLAGRARFTAGRKTIDVAPGDVIFVAAKEVHHFHDVGEDLALLVVFGPAEGTRAATSATSS